MKTSKVTRKRKMKNTLKNALAVLSSALATVTFASDVYVGDGANNNTYTDTAAYASATKIIKTGTGTTTLDLGDMTGSFIGEIEVQEGELKVASTPNSFGAPSRITVSSGATLNLSWSGTDTGKIPDAEIFIEGDGAGSNRGALRREARLDALDRLIGKLVLTGDSRIVTGSRTGFKTIGTTNKGYVRLNGHKLVKTSSAPLVCNNTVFYGTDGTTDNPGDILIERGTLLVQNGNSMQCGGAENTIELKSGTTLELSRNNPLLWSVNATGAATISSAYQNLKPSQLEPDRNTISGSLTAASDLSVLANGTQCSITLRDATSSLGGNLIVTNSGIFAIADSAVTNTASGRVLVENGDGVARLSIEGASEMVGMVGGSNYGQTRFYAGNTAGSYGTVSIDGSSSVTNYSLQIGGGGCGALYQRGGASYWLVGQFGYDRIGDADGSYGYVGVTGGRFGMCAVGSGKTALVGVNGMATLALCGGTADFMHSGKIAFAYRAVPFTYYQSNGSVANFDSQFDIGDNNSRNYAGDVSLTVTGEGTALNVSDLMRIFHTHENAKAFVNLNSGGTLRAKSMYKLDGANVFYFNLDGGVIRPTGNFTYDYNQAFRRPTASTVFENGFTIDMTDNTEMTMPISFVAPGAGQRVASIALPADAGFAAEQKVVGSPLVTISGDGTGATAFALFDDTTRTVTNIVVTSRGWGYSTATATISGGGLSTAYACAVTLEDQPTTGWKGFTKRGAAMLKMTGTNTFRGDVAVEEGTLSFLNDGASQGGMPEGAGITVSDGAVVSFRNADTPVSVPFLAGCGSSGNGAFTVTNRIECKAADIFAGKHLTVGCNLTLADGVKIVVTDPENLVSYRDRPAATVVSCGGTLVAQGSLVVEFGAPCETESLDLWRVRVKGNSVVLGHRKGMILTFR